MRASLVVKNPPAKAETPVESLIWKDPTCCGTTKPMSLNHWACAPGPGSRGYWSLSTQSPCSATRGATAVRSSRTATKRSPHSLKLKRARAATKTHHSQKKRLSHLCQGLVLISTITKLWPSYPTLKIWCHSPRDSKQWVGPMVQVLLPERSNYIFPKHLLHAPVLDTDWLPFSQYWGMGCAVFEQKWVDLRTECYKVYCPCRRILLFYHSLKRSTEWFKYLCDPMDCSP